MAHMPRNDGNDGETSHQKALAGKWEGIRHFPSKLLEQIRNEARNKKHCCDKWVILNKHNRCMSGDVLKSPSDFNH